jgi:hypothetical protein
MFPLSKQDSQGVRLTHCDCGKGGFWKSWNSKIEKLLGIPIEPVNARVNTSSECSTSGSRPEVKNIGFSPPPMK